MSSYTRVQPEKIIEAAQRVLAEIAATRKADNERFLLEKLAKKNFWRRLFLMRKLTLDDVRNMYRHKSITIGFGLTSIYPSDRGWREEHEAIRLLNAARHSAKCVLLDVDDAMLLFGEQK